MPAAGEPGLRVGGYAGRGARTASSPPGRHAVNLGWLPIPWPGDAVEPLGDLRRLLLGLFDDVSAMARATSSIPELGRQLAAIERHVASLDREVAEMRRGVESLQGNMVELSTTLAPVGALAGRLRGGRVRVRRAARDGALPDEAAIEP